MPTSTVATQLTGPVTGVVHDAQQPIAGARVYLLAASTTGDGGAGIPPSSSNASISLLTNGSATDAPGTYVLTTSDGSFSIAGNYTCTAGQQV